MHYDTPGGRLPSHRKISLQTQATFRVKRDFSQIEWPQAADDCRQIVRLAVREDLDRFYDWTTVALVPEEQTGRAALVSRRPGTVAGLPAVELVLEEMQADVRCQALASDGEQVAAGGELAAWEGSARDMLTCERLALNLLGRMSGIATLTRQYVDLVAGTAARIYDTRKTTPGLRRIEKYAVRCGGGHNHRLGLFDAVLIKDNHLAFCRAAGKSPGQAVEEVRQLLEETSTAAMESAGADSMAMPIEIEVDSLAQLREVLPARPDIVLLDNMPAALLRQAVALRDDTAPEVELEASGGVNLETVRSIAETGVERISVGALTHSAVSLDVGLDWQPSP